MEFLELSIEKLKEEDKKIYQLIKKEFDYDCVIFIAKGSYLIGKDLAEFNQVPLLEVFATRSGGKMKKIISPFLKLVPKFLKVKLRKYEFNSNYHEKNSQRNVQFNEDVWEKYKECKKILLVDDSVDTGFSMKKVFDVVSNYFSESDVRIAALNYFSKSKSVIETNYYLYVDTMLQGPWSNDSMENKRFLELYSNWKKTF